MAAQALVWPCVVTTLDARKPSVLLKGKQSVRRHKRHSKQRLAMLAMMPDRCRAHARSTGKPCVAKAMANGRCKNHGGMCTGAKTPEGRARISAAQTRRWEAWREKTGRTKPAAAPVPIIPEPPTDILQRLMKGLTPAKNESATEKWLREELESSNTPGARNAGTKACRASRLARAGCSRGTAA